MNCLLAASLTVVTTILVALPNLNAAEPISLFDGATLSGWTTLGGKPVTRRWEVENGMLHLRTDGGRSVNIVTEQEYADFELSFEWKITVGGNNGVKYRVQKYGNRTLGCEYQIIDDDGYRHPLPENGTTGALYDIYEPNHAKWLKPAGQFNHSRIVVFGNRIEHFLNGQLIVVAHVGGQEWNRRVAESKFADVEGFGQNRMGKIMLTDHNSEVWYRKIELTPLASTIACQQVVKCGEKRRGLLRRILRRRSRCR